MLLVWTRLFTLTIKRGILGNTKLETVTKFVPFKHPSLTPTRQSRIGKPLELSKAKLALMTLH